MDYQKKKKKKIYKEFHIKHTKDKWLFKFF